MHDGGRLRQAATVLLTVLLVTATFAPVAAYPTDDDPGLSESERRSIAVADGAIDRLSTFADPSPRDRKRTAVGAVREFDTKGVDDGATARDRLGRLLDGTLPAYRNGTRVDTAAVFARDAAAIEALETFRGTDQDARVELVSRLLVQADGATARLAVADARRALGTAPLRAQASEEILREAREELSTADEELEQADDELQTADGADLETRLDARQNAIEAYGEAWTHAQRALARLEAATSPQVTIERRLDLPREKATNTTVVGRVTAVRPSAYETVTVRVDGDPTVVPLNASSAPASNATFEADVTLPPGVVNVTATVGAGEPVVPPAFADERVDAGLPGGVPGPFEGGVRSPFAAELPYVNGTGDRVPLPAATGSVPVPVDAPVPFLTRESTTLPVATPDVAVTDDEGELKREGTADGAEYNYEFEYADADGDRRAESGELKLEYKGALEYTYELEYADVDGDGELETLKLKFDAKGDVERKYELEFETDDDERELKLKLERKGLVEGKYELERKTESDTQELKLTAERKEFDDEYKYDLESKAEADERELKLELERKDAVEEKYELEWTDDGDGTVEQGEVEYEPEGYPERVVASDTVALDGDGLPAAYEREVTGTDPYDPDSDSSRTSADEADDGVLDGLEDFDNDTLITYDEYVAGTDPFAADSDEDGLTDRVETTYPRLDPLAADSDGDGTPDAVSDPDNDSLTTSEEIAFGSNPFDADTDRDQLDDGMERELGTEPLTPDTDGDGLLDGVEVRLGTDPRVVDSDGDGIADGNETFTTTATNASVETRVNITGQGDLAAGVTIERDTAESFDTSAITNASASPLIELASERSFEQAEVTIGYNASQVGNESDLAIYTFNRTLQTFVKLDSTVDATNDTVTATTDHFSRFVVFDEAAWAREFRSSSGPVDQSGESTTPIVTDGFDDLTGWTTDGQVQLGSDGVAVTSTGLTGGTGETLETPNSVDGLAITSLHASTPRVDPEQAISFYATLRNDRDTSYDRTVQFTLGGEVVAETFVSIPAGETRDLSASLRYDGLRGQVTAGEYTLGVRVNGESVTGDGAVTVLDDVDPAAAGTDQLVADPVGPSGSGLVLTGLRADTAPVGDGSVATVAPQGSVTFRGTLENRDFPTYFEGLSYTFDGRAAVRSTGLVGVNGRNNYFFYLGHEGIRERIGTGTFAFGAEAGDLRYEPDASVRVLAEKSRIERTVSIDAEAVPAEAERVRFSARVATETSAPAREAVATVRVETSEGEQTVYRATDARPAETVTADLTGVRGEDVTVEVVAEEGATVRVSEVEFAAVTGREISDTDGDGISDARERAGIPTGRAGTVFTDPFDADTDNDGLSDGAELGQFVNVSADGTRITNTEDLPDGVAIPEATTLTQGSYYRLKSDPTARDTDRDGLTDFQEVRGERPVRYTATREATQEAIDAQVTLADPLQYFEPESATSSAFFADTDGDGLDDGREAELRTDPRSLDTDGDGITDGVELATGQDPTLYDATAPTVTVLSVEATGTISGPELAAEYTVRFRVSDAAGVANVTLAKGLDGVDDIPGSDGARTTIDLGGTDRTGVVTRSLTTGAYGRFLFERLSIGPSIRIRAVDTNGNAFTDTYLGPSAYSRLADLAAANPAVRLGVDQALEDPVALAAALSGSIYGIRSTANGLRRLAELPISTAEFLYTVAQEPEEFAVALGKAVSVADRLASEPAILAEVVGSLDDPIIANQRIQNPFGPGFNNRTFADGWYGGYLAGLVGSELLVGRGAVLTTQALAETYTTAERALELYRGAEAFVVGNTLGRSAQLARLGARQLVRSVDEFGEAAYTGLRRGLSPLSGASQYAVVQQVRALPGDVRRAASDSGVSEALVDYAARTGDNFRELAQYVTPDGYVSVLRLRRADGSGYVGDTAGETIIGRTVAEAGLPEARTDEIVRRFGDRFKSTEQLDRFGDALRRANRDTEFVEQFSPREAADLADAGFLRSTVEIFDMGFSRQRIDELLARGVSPNAINDGLREYAYAPGRLTETAQEGDIGEVLADAIVIRRQSRYADSERYRILPVDADKDANGINLDPNTVGEFDHVVVDQRSGKVVAVYETKIKSSLDGGEDAPAVQARDTIENLLTDDDATVSPSFLDKSQFRDTDIESLGIGPNDVTYETDGSIPYSNAELRALFESITASDVTKSDIQAVAERTAS